MEKQTWLISWWRLKRAQIRSQLREKAKTQPLSEVESMIMNPFTLEQARNQVRSLNRSVGYKKIGGGGGSKLIP